MGVLVGWDESRVIVTQENVLTRKNKESTNLNLVSRILPGTESFSVFLRSKAIVL
jgi:hypothetical protein